MKTQREGINRFMVWMAILTLLLVVFTTVYSYMFSETDEMNILEYRRGNLRLEDGVPEEALAEFDKVLETQPGHVPSFLGRGLALMAMGKNEEALESFNTALRLKPDFGAVYADRGILNDRMGNHQAAIHDYRKAIALDPHLAKGPNWLIRFLRLQNDKPSTIADRADYLEAELKKPPEERQLVNLEIDSQQRSYKVEGTLDPPR